MLNAIPHFDDPIDMTTVEDFLAAAAEGFDPSKTSSILDRLHALWPGIDEDGNPTGLSPEAFSYISRVVHSAHSDPSIMTQFSRSRSAVLRIVSVQTQMGIAVGE